MNNGNYSLAFNFSQNGTYNVIANASKNFAVNGSGSYSMAVGHIINRFTIDDSTLTPTQTAFFTTYLNNSDSESNLYTNKSEIQFMYASNFSIRETSALTGLSDQTIAPGSSISDSFSRAFSTFPDGIYIAKLVVNYTYNGLYTQNQTNITFSITTPVGGGGGGGGGGGTGISAPPVPLTFKKLPILREGEPANPVLVDLVMENPTTTDRVVSVASSGVPIDWMVTINDAGLIHAGETKTHTIAFNIPKNADPRDYLVGLDVNLAGVLGKTNFILRVKKYPNDYDVPKVFRTVDVNFKDSTSAIKQNIINGDTFRQSVFIYETIPKEIAGTAADLNFKTAPTRIIKNDPIVLWVLQDVQPQQRQDVSYDARSIATQYEPYIYYLSNEVVAISIRQQEYVKASNIFVSPMTQGGRNNFVAVDLTNSYTQPIAVDTSIFSNQRWSIFPENAHVSVPGKGTITTRFNVSIPGDTKTGTYVGALFLRYQNVTTSKDIQFVVGAGGVAGFFGFDVMIWVLLIGILVIIASYIISKRVYGQELSRYSFAEDRFKILRDIKELIKRK